jgi:hypothetical protein
MRTIVAAGLVAVVIAGAGRAQDSGKMPAPQKEHEWLKAFAGEWESEAEMVMAPGQPPVKSKGTESAKLLGGFWLVSEMKGECMGVPVTGLMTVGYDAQKKKYVGTWVCSMCDWLCKYEGSADGKVLTLECEGPHPETGKLVKMKDVVELKDKDHKTLTSSMLGDDGKWVTFMTMTSKRKK